MVVGCEHKCEITKEWDDEYEKYYYYIECPICGYYWEGYLN
ncbi:hypothetical protein [Clostridium sp. VAP23]|nr:hypothetical protein [Clostridium sp. VAP23]